MSNHPKELRKQVRNVTQELLPELLKSEVFQGLYERLQKEMTAQLAITQQNIIKILTEMNEKAKDTQQFLMNEIMSNISKNSPKVNPADAPLEIKSEKTL